MFIKFKFENNPMLYFLNLLYFFRLNMLSLLFPNKEEVETKKKKKQIKILKSTHQN